MEICVLRSLRGRKKGTCPKDNHCFLSIYQIGNCFTPPISFIPPNNKEVGTIFISILQVRYREVKKLPEAMQLELGRGAFQQGPITEPELFVLRLSCLLINHQRRLWAPSRGQLVPSS